MNTDCSQKYTTLF